MFCNQMSADFQVCMCVLCIYIAIMNGHLQQKLKLYTWQCPSDVCGCGNASFMSRQQQLLCYVCGLRGDVLRGCLTWQTSSTRTSSVRQRRVTNMPYITSGSVTSTFCDSPLICIALCCDQFAGIVFTHHEGHAAWRTSLAQNSTNLLCEDFWNSGPGCGKCKKYASQTDHQTKPRHHFSSLLYLTQYLLQ